MKGPDIVEVVDDSVLAKATSIVVAFVSNPNNQSSTTSLKDLIREVYSTLKGLDSKKPENIKYFSTGLAPQKPFVDPEASVFNDYIICLEDGAKLKMLTRHIKQYNLTPEQYREKWNLPGNYPMTCPAYSVVRSQLAKESGLGKREDERPFTLSAEPEPAPVKGKARKAPTKAPAVPAPAARARKR